MKTYKIEHTMYFCMAYLQIIKTKNEAISSFFEITYDKKSCRKKPEAEIFATKFSNGLKKKSNHFV